MRAQGRRHAGRAAGADRRDGVDLAWKILQATKRDLGEKAVDPEQMALLDELVVKRERFGRKNGKGFYDYPPKPRRRRSGRASRTSIRRSGRTTSIVRS